MARNNYWWRVLCFALPYSASEIITGDEPGEEVTEGLSETDNWTKASDTATVMATNPNAPYKFSPEEVRVLQECNRESFWQRCMPIGTALSVGTFIAVKNGYLKGNVRFGPAPKMFAAACVGYFIGKFSYQPICLEKIMALPNSQLADMIRKRKGKMGLQETFTSAMDPGFNTSTQGTPGSSEDSSHSSLYTDVNDSRPYSSFDNEAVFYTGQDRFDTTEEMLSDENLPVKRAKASTTYEELRRQNRDDFRNKSMGLASGSPPPSMVGSPVNDEYSRRRESEPQVSPSSPKPKNKYGDVWES